MDIIVTDDLVSMFLRRFTTQLLQLKVKQLKTYPEDFSFVNVASINITNKVKPIPSS